MPYLLIITVFLLFSGGKFKVFADSRQCMSGFRSSEMLNDWAIQTKTTLDTHPHQQLYPSINFTCSGLLTEWIMKARSELVQLNFSSYVYPELQIWRPVGGSNQLYNKVGSSVINVSPNQVTHIYTVRPDPPLSFQNGDIFGIWEGTNNYANTREVDNIRPVSGTRHTGTEGFNYEALSPQTSYTGGEESRNLGVPLVAVETEPAGCNSFINLETLATYATKVSSCSLSYCLHIIPQMTFTCGGNITGWTAGASWVNTNDAMIIPELQIWRKDLGTTSSYSRVTSIPLTPTPPENPNINGGYIKKQLFSNSFNPPVIVSQGDVLGLLLSTRGQLLIQMASFSFISLPNNYIFMSDSAFTDMTTADLQSSRVTSTEFLQPLISLEISPDNSVAMETTHAEPQTTTTPTTTTPPPASTKLSSTSSHTTTDAHTSTQPTTALEGESHLTTDAFSAKNALESKHIFGIIVAVISLVVLLLIFALTALGLFLLVKSRRRRRGRGQFVETFIETNDNEAYRSRTTLLTRLTRHDINVPPNSHPQAITTTSNVAYVTAVQSERTVIANPIIEDRNHNLAQNAAHVNSIVTTSNMAYQVKNGTFEASAGRCHGDVTLPGGATQLEVDQNCTFKIKVNESYCTEVATKTKVEGEGLPGSSGLEASGTMSSQSGDPSSTKPQSTTHDTMVKPYQVTKLPCVEFIDV